jgi:predicted MFS family arabinose efflux permease
MFLMGTTEFVVAGLLPEIAGELQVSVAQSGLLITEFALGNVVAAKAAGPAASSRAMGLVGAGAMLANVIGVPLGALAGHVIGWRGPFWVLALLAVACVPLIARTVPNDGPDRQAASIRSEAAGLRSGRLWLVLAACATTTGGVLAAYSYISPLLTERAGITAGLVPLVLVGFGSGALAGSIIGGRLGDRRPHAVTIVTAAVASLLLQAICLFSASAWATVILVALLGCFGLGANPVLISMAVGTVIAALTLIPTIAIALEQHHKNAAAQTYSPKPN